MLEQLSWHGNARYAHFPVNLCPLGKTAFYPFFPVSKNPEYESRIDAA